MDKEADFVFVAELAQHLGQRNQMIVVHPHHVVRAQQLLQIAGEEFIDPQIAAKIAAGEFGEIEPVMQDRPQHTVGKTVVEFLVVVLAQTDGHVRNVVVLDRLGCPRMAIRNAPAPAEPDAAPPPERRPNRHFEPAGPRSAVGNANAVGDYDEPRQYRSPQLRDSLIAVIINPDIEYVCGKFPHNLPVNGCTSSDRIPYRFRNRSASTNMSRASSRRPISHNASINQNRQIKNAVSGMPKSSAAA